MDGAEGIIGELGGDGRRAVPVAPWPSRRRRRQCPRFPCWARATGSRRPDDWRAAGVASAAGASMVRITSPDLSCWATTMMDLLPPGLGRAHLHFDHRQAIEVQHQIASLAREARARPDGQPRVASRPAGGARGGEASVRGGSNHGAGPELEAEVVHAGWRLGDMERGRCALGVARICAAGGTAVRGRAERARRGARCEARRPGWLPEGNGGLRSDSRGSWRLGVRGPAVPEGGSQAGRPGGGAAGLVAAGACEQQPRGAGGRRLAGTGAAGPAGRALQWCGPAAPRCHHVTRAPGQAARWLSISTH